MEVGCTWGWFLERAISCRERVDPSRRARWKQSRGNGPGLAVAIRNDDRVLERDDITVWDVEHGSMNGRNANRQKHTVKKEP
jgi:hypothetical protein